MGQEVESTHFHKRDFDVFSERLRAETGLLAAWFEAQRFVEEHPVGGFELEACLIDAQCQPAPINEDYLARLHDPDVVPELARFNVELNTPPQVLSGDALSCMHERLQEEWRAHRGVAEELGTELLMSGILPTLCESDLSLANMSDLRRYHALNEQVLRLREGQPLRLDIVGRERLEAVHQDVMFEAATTSFQLHLQVPQASAVRYYNAAQILSAPMVAASANSPYLFGRDLWEETRIPVFEEAVEVGGVKGAAQGPLRRVSFGTGYARRSLFEVFEENLAHFPVMLPVGFDQPADTLSHLRLHNGTIWRWNRPLIGFDEGGRPHLRIEHRVIPSGPTLVDAIANAALFYGAVQALATQPEAPEAQLEFALARDNFYQAARYGLTARTAWLEGRHGSVRSLLQDVLLPLARQGLQQLDIAQADIDAYLGVIEARLHSGQTGSAWQHAFTEKHGRDMAQLTAAMLENQLSERPVHEWPV